MSNTEDIKDDRVPSCLRWSKEQVADWIEELGFPYYKDCVITNGIDGRKLIMVDASAMPRIGINDFEHIKFIAKNIRELLGIADPCWSRSISLPPREDLGMYLEVKCSSGKENDELTYKKFLQNHPNAKWRPPLGNQCLVLPHD